MKERKLEMGTKKKTIRTKRAKLKRMRRVKKRKEIQKIMREKKRRPENGKYQNREAIGKRLFQLILT